MATGKPTKMEVRIIKAQEAPVEKADTSVQVTTQEAYNAGDWITPRNDMRGLARLVENSTILPQCIRAYKNNISRTWRKRRKWRRSSAGRRR